MEDINIFKMHDNYNPLEESNMAMFMDKSPKVGDAKYERNVKIKRKLIQFSVLMLKPKCTL
jgi:hypothetical protein